MKRWLILAALAFGGCASDEKTRTTDDIIDDHAIEADVNRRLGRVTGVDRLKLRIECVKGRVTLSGNVPDDDAAKRACEAAGEASGVEGVVDQLQREKK